MDNSCNDSPGWRLADRVAHLDLRPLSARSVVLSALLGTHPPVMPVSALVALAERFGVSSGALRTALSRMVAGDELTAHDGRYELTGRLLDRQREQDLGRHRATHEWDGTWWVVSALATRRTAADRRRFRSAMEGAKLGELRPDTWMRPANIPVVVELGEVVVSRGGLPSAISARLVGELWDLAASEERAGELADALELVDEALAARAPGTESAPGEDARVAGSPVAGSPVDDAATDDSATGGASTGDVIAPAFTVLAACLRFLRVEPQLPDSLAPTPAGDRLRERYMRTEPAVQSALRDLYRATMADTR